MVEVYLNYIPVGRVGWSCMVEPSLRIRGARIPSLVLLAHLRRLLPCDGRSVLRQLYI
jgi:hypothetical protein